MSAHKLRRGFGAEVNEVFAEAHEAACGDTIAEIEAKQEAIEALRKELWTTIRELQKAAKGSAR